ncbi:MAG: trypsin-like peptidase domain-containing protein [Clostridia bacterium]|nr:trypsin-like peptidase domain-containing protein [Clostridia bacterium]
MENKKFNMFAVVMIVIMAMFTIYTGINGGKAKDGRDGMSAYEMAVENGEFSGSEFEYLQSLHGKDGSNITLEMIYEAYLEEIGKTSSEYTFTDFILNFYPDEILSSDETATAVKSATQSALRSTVDICYSFCLDEPIIYVSETKIDGVDSYQIDTSAEYYNRYASIGVSAGSGVIYKIDDAGTAATEDDVAYIITNYHVVYASNFVSDESKYRVYVTENEMFTATYSDLDVKTKTIGSGIFATTVDISYIEKSDVVEAPIETHFLDDYSIYLYGYQSEEYKLTASFVGGSAENDIAVLKVERNKSQNNERLFGENYKPVDLGDSKDLDVGETIIAVGNPLLADTSNIKDGSGAKVYVEDLKNRYVDALCLTSTDGVVSNVSEYCKFGHQLDAGSYVNMRLIRVSAAINAGNSGGGLYDVSGKLVGIVNGKIVSEEYDNVGFAIPVNIAARLADKIIAECDGETTRVEAIRATSESLGITVENGESKTIFDSNVAGGSFVVKNNVLVKTRNLSMAGSGLEIGNVISSVSFNDESVKYKLDNDYDLNDVLLIAKKGETTKIVLHVLQSGSTTKQVIIDVTDDMFVEII